MRITVNLASRPFADVGPVLERLRIAMGVLAAVAIALGFGLHFLAHKADAARAREHSFDTSIARINQERQSYQAMMRQPRNVAVLDQAEALNKLIDDKSFSWTLAMEDLETVLPGGVQVTTLEPAVDRKTGQITVRLRVVGPRDKAVELVENLEHSHRFLEPRIIGETAQTSNAPGAALQPASASSPVNFDVLADYNPATPAERHAAKKKAGEQETAEAQATTPRTTAFHGGPSLRRPSAGMNAPARHRKPNPKPNSKPNPGAPR